MLSTEAGHLINYNGSFRALWNLVLNWHPVMELLKHFSVKVTKRELTLYIMASIKQTANIRNSPLDFKTLKSSTEQQYHLTRWTYIIKHWIDLWAAGGEVFFFELLAAFQQVGDSSDDYSVTDVYEIPVLGVCYLRYVFITEGIDALESPLI